MTTALIDYGAGNLQSVHTALVQAGATDVVLAADCVAFSFADFHNRFLAGKILAIACPKLDSNKESYVEKLKDMIQLSSINTLTVIIMEVPCCGGLLQLASKAVAESGRKIPLELVIIGTQGDVLREEWV